MKTFFTICCTVVLSCCSINSYAQKKDVGKAYISLGIEGALPAGEFSKQWSAGVGGSLKAAFYVLPGGDVTLSAGYIIFAGKTVELPFAQQAFMGQTYKTPVVSAIPLKAGFQYKIGRYIYVEPQAGYSLYKIKNQESEGAFTYAGNIGAVLLKNKFDLSIRYEAANKNSIIRSHVGLRAAWILQSRTRK